MERTVAIPRRGCLLSRCWSVAEGQTDQHRAYASRDFDLERTASRSPISYSAALDAFAY